ncbi:MAG: DUF4013 domain-containing protein [Methanosarcina sp.]|jgi:hypothetical protein|uniref:DUF4013 domain-containing protein n=1 Tax=Methanosarcina sp. TaxID=2213 RepID=UPI003BB8038B
MVIFIETISLSDAFKYPFKDPKKLLYALLLLIPILGWLVLFGYIVRLVNEFIEGRYEEPLDLDLMEDLKLGAITFVKALPFYIVYAVVIFAINYISPNLGSLIELMLGFFVIPILAVNFFRKQTIESFFEFDLLNVVKDNFEEYVMAALKQYAVAIVFAILSIILIGIPALCFTSSIFIANFYGRIVEQKNTPIFKPQLDEPSTI